MGLDFSINFSESLREPLLAISVDCPAEGRGREVIVVLAGGAYGNGLDGGGDIGGYVGGGPGVGLATRTVTRERGTPLWAGGRGNVREGGDLLGDCAGAVEEGPGRPPVTDAWLREEGRDSESEDHLLGGIGKERYSLSVSQSPSRKLHRGEEPRRRWLDAKVWDISSLRKGSSSGVMERSSGDARHCRASSRSAKTVEYG